MTTALDRSLPTHCIPRRPTMQDPTYPRASAVNQQTYEQLKLALGLHLRRQLFIGICDNLNLRNQLAMQLHAELGQGQMQGGYGMPAGQLVSLMLDLNDPNPVGQVARWLQPQLQGGGDGTLPGVLGFQMLGIEHLTQQPPAVQRLFLSYLRSIDRSLIHFNFSLVLWVNRPWGYMIRQFAPECWNWCTGVFEFLGDPVPLISPLFDAPPATVNAAATSLAPPTPPAAPAPSPAPQGAYGDLLGILSQDLAHLTATDPKPRTLSETIPGTVPGTIPEAIPGTIPGTIPEGTLTPEDAPDGLLNQPPNPVPVPAAPSAVPQPPLDPPSRRLSPPRNAFEDDGDPEIDSFILRDYQGRLNQLVPVESLEALNAKLQGIRHPNPPTQPPADAAPGQDQNPPDSYSSDSYHQTQNGSGSEDSGHNGSIATNGHPGQNGLDQNTQAENGLSQNTQGQNGLSQNTQGQNTQGQNTQGQNTQAQNTQAQNTQEQNTQEQNTQEQNTQEQNGFSASPLLPPLGNSEAYGFSYQLPTSNIPPADPIDPQNPNATASGTEDTLPPANPYGSESEFPPLSPGAISPWSIADPDPNDKPIALQDTNPEPHSQSSIIPDFPTETAILSLETAEMGQSLPPLSDLTEYPLDPSLCLEDQGLTPPDPRTAEPHSLDQSSSSPDPSPEDDLLPAPPATIADLKSRIEQLRRDQAPLSALAAAYLDLGRYYRTRIEEGNTQPPILEGAVMAYEQVLEWLCFSEVSPAELGNVAWSDILNDLGTLYWMAARSPSSGDLAAQYLNQAVQSYQLGLKKTDEGEQPRSYAMLQNNLGTVYSDLAQQGDTLENLRLAITAYTAALRHRRPDTDPLKFAATQNNLGTAYWHLAQHEQPVHNLQAAIVAYGQALHYYQPQQEPTSYAMIQNNLGTAYWNLAQHMQQSKQPLPGSEGVSCKDWLLLAVDAYRSALHYRTLETAPAGYAATQNNLGTAYWHLANLCEDMDPKHGDYMKLSIQAYEAALEAAHQVTYRDRSGILSFDRYATYNNLGMAHFQWATHLHSQGSAFPRHPLDWSAEDHLLAALKNQIRAVQGWQSQPEFYQTALTHAVQTIRCFYDHWGTTGQNKALAQIPGELLSVIMAKI